jgi:MFS family permease
MDFGGIIVLSFAIVSLLYCVLYGQKHSFYSSYVLITFLCAITLLFIFYFVERKVKQPIMPFEIFTKTNTVDNIISFLASASLMGLDVYMPVYLQNVLGFNATISGLSMAPMSVAWLIAAVVLSNAIIKYGEGNVIIVSSAVLLISMLFLPTLTISSPLILVIIYVSMMGFGFGGLLTILTIIIQESVDYGNRGAAMACNSLLRTLGQTIGVSILGGIFNLSMSKNLSNFKIRNIDINNIYSSMNLKDAAYISHVKMSINSGLHSVFISLIVLSIFCFLLSFMLPNNLKNKK